MPKIVTLADTEAFRRLGSRSQVLPEMFDQYVPTVEFFDMAKFLPGPLPPRGIVGTEVIPGVGNTAGFDLDCNAEGGMVIEEITVDADGAGVWRMQRSGPLSGLPVNIDQMDLSPEQPAGALSFTAVFHAGPVVGVSAAGVELPQTHTIRDLNAFVPRGQRFGLRFGVVNVTGRVTIRWYEFTIASRSPR